MNPIRLSCGFPWDNNSLEKEAELSTMLRVASFAIGVFAVIVSGLIFYLPGLNTIPSYVGWASFFLGAVAICVGACARCVEDSPQENEMRSRFANEELYYNYDEDFSGLGFQGFGDSARPVEKRENPFVIKSVLPEIKDNDPEFAKWKEAIEKEEIEKIREAINAKTFLADLSKCLHVAAEHGYVELISLFLENGAEVKDYEGLSPIHRVFWCEDEKKVLKTLEVFIAKDPTLVLSRAVGEITPLHLAVGRQMITCIELILANKALVNAQDCYGNTPLHVAVRESSFEIEKRLPDIKVIDILLKAGADINLKNMDNNSFVWIVKTKFADWLMNPDNGIWLTSYF